MGDVSSAQPKRKVGGKPCKMANKKWTPKEDAILIAALAELCNAGWKRENGIFRNGYTAALERKLKLRLPGCNIKASPHIESRLKLLKRQYDAITELQGAAGIEWDIKESIVRCEDDNVWEEWIETHSDAKGLRNKEFPYYKDLHLIFGNRSTRKGVNIEFDYDEENNATTHMTADDSCEEDEEGNYELLQIGGADSSIERYKKRKVQIGVPMNASEDSTGTNKSEGDDPLTEGTIRTDVQPRASTTDVLNKKSCISGGSGSSELGELAKIFGAFLDKYQEHLSLLSELLGREKISEKIATEKRAKVNEELMKLPDLNLQSRLRAASKIVSDPAKLDLFYSLPEDERREWVSMLLAGFI